MKWRLFATTMRGVAVYRELRKLVPAVQPISVITARKHRLEPAYEEELAKAVAAAGDVLSYDGEGVEIGECDVALACNWRRRLGPEVRSRASVGCFIIHDSLLPQLRGFSPLVNAIRSGLNVTGATLFRAVDEIDAGAILRQEEVPLPSTATVTDILPMMDEAYRRILRRVVPVWASGGHVVETEQDHSKATESPRIDWVRDPEISLDWQRARVRDHIRAFQPPYPRAFVTKHGRKLDVSTLEDYDRIIADN